VINNKVSNVCSGGDGVADAELVCQAVAEALQLSGGSKTVLPSSTGVIGWRLPAQELANDVVPIAVKNLQTVSALNAAKAICTTDRFPKVRSKTLSTGARLVGIVKGAGMIEPNMATMLVGTTQMFRPDDWCFVVTYLTFVCVCVYVHVFSFHGILVTE
jgi:glutamate N-acetyltransferase / amino-acid N-acetyltransferase